MSSTTFAHVSLVASYHFWKKVKGSVGKTFPAMILLRVSSIISSHWVVSPSGSPPISAAFLQAPTVASNQVFQISLVSIRPEMLACTCSWALPTVSNHKR